MPYRASRKYSDASEEISLSHLTLAIIALIAAVSGIALVIVGLIE